jgi:hypothetical protein
MTRRLTQQEFISKAREVHGDRYDYSNSVYVSTRAKLEISCSVHGKFIQAGYSHLRGSGCGRCSTNINAATIKNSSKQKFLEKAIDVHGNFYNYAQTNYIDCYTKVKIVCPIHGQFEQLPHAHLRGSGCFKCGFTKISESKTSNPTGWDITNWQKSAKRSKNFDSFKVYIFKLFNEHESFYKIGRTYRKSTYRIQEIPYQVTVIHEIQNEDLKIIFDLENDLKQKYKSYKYLPKVEFAGMYECFSIDLPVHQIIEQYPQTLEVESDFPNPELHLQVRECLGA